MDNNNSLGSGGSGGSPHSMSPFLNSPLNFGQSLQSKGGILRAAAAMAAEPALPPMPMHHPHLHPHLPQLPHHHHHHLQQQQQHLLQSSQKRQLSPNAMENSRGGYERPPIKREKLDSEAAQLKEESFNEKKIHRRSPG